MDSDRRIVCWVQRLRDRDTLQLQWHDQSGRRRSRSARTADPAIAEQRRADLEYELNHSLYREPSRLTWADFRSLFEQEVLTGRRVRTRMSYRRTLDLFEQFASPGRLASVTTRTVSVFVARLRELPEPGRSGITGYHPSTIATHVMHLHAALAWAVEQKLLPELPRFPRIDVPRKHPQPVPPEHVERLLERIQDAQLHAYALCGWLAGLRRDEAFSLSWEASEEAPWVNLVARRIVFPAEAVKGRADQWVPLDPELEAALCALPSFREGGKVFRFEGKGRAICSFSVVQRLVRVAKLAGVRITMRTLRRGFACRYASRVPAQVLQRLCRHSDIKVTLTYYASMDAAVEEAVFGRVDRRDTRTAGSRKPQE